MKKISYFTLVLACLSVLMNGFIIYRLFSFNINATQNNIENNEEKKSLNEEELKECLNAAFNARAERRKATLRSSDKNGTVISQTWSDGVEAETINTIYLHEIKVCYESYK